MRSGFVLSSDADLAAILTSSIKEVWINSHKGLDVAADVPAVTEAESEAEITASLAPVATANPNLSALTIEQEIERAARICAQAKEAVETMFDHVRMGQSVDVGSASEELDVVASSSSVTLGETYSIFLSVAPTLGAPVGSARTARLKLAAGVFSESCAQYCRFDVRMRQLGFYAFEAELLSESGSVAAVRSVHVFVFENATVWLGEPTSADDVTAADAEFLFRKCAVCCMLSVV